MSARPALTALARRLALPLAALLAVLLTALVAAGCATTADQAAPDADATAWNGRLALQVESQPPQAFAASFALEGAPQAGQLTLISPLGSTLAVMRWAPGQAVLMQGGQTRAYASLDEMIEQATGAPLPVRALFGWLRGQPQEVPGWHVDLTGLPGGRLNARRLMPLPAADLRIVLDR